ncbi:MAG: response regulator transcription factor [Solirubrobacteraceae bacterium]
MRGAFEVDRVSVARIDLEASRFEITGDAGAKLLAPGTELPLSTCSYFAQVAEGQAFHDEDFDASAAFDRPLDSIVLLTGFHSGCSVPLRAGGRVVGALSLSATASHRAMTEFASELEAVGDVLTASLLAARPPRGEAVGLTARERELLDGLEQGLRFKQIARRLGISEATAKTHARNLFRKLDATSRAEAVHVARERGVLA